ncbi:uncharacterized protein LOC120635966 [Pararge aegeria]|uniref:uncharacterized protein LOC120635966 n=1 Tax=Pararge aegeria TaxID=116150 RepID=UPI0019D20553|nr:uncharacterized protein LOC120635966 [Pararge aegeria]
MKGLQDLMRNIDIKPFHVNTEHLVNITHINNPHDFYVRNVKYMHVVLKIENLKRLPPACSVKMDEIVLFDMDTDSSTTRYARGQVRNIEEIVHSVICTLSAIDYGFFVKVPLECIYKCDNLVLVLPPLAYKCRLAHCDKKGDSWGLAIDAFKSYVSTIEHTKMLIQGQIADKLIVKLGKTEKEDLATILSYTSFTRLAGVPDKINGLQPTAAALPINLSGYTLKDRKTNVKLQVTVLSGSSLQDFYVAEINDYKQYIESREKFAKYAIQEPKCEEGTLKKGDNICIKDFLNMYERAIIKEVLDPTKALVFMVDKGQEVPVHYKNMRKMPRQFMDIPVVAIWCSIPENLANKISGMMVYPGRKFYITIKELGHGFNTPNVVDISTF